MYKKLYATWKREIENPEIQSIPANFYSDIANYFLRLKKEGRMLDKRSMKAKLLRDEIRNVRQIFQNLFETRCRKLIKKVARGEKISSGFLTNAEKDFYTHVLPPFEELQKLAEDISLGYTPKMEESQKIRKAVVRFLKEVPAIIGADMSTYGPFKPGDVASLPLDNSKILVKQNLAERVKA